MKVAAAKREYLIGDMARIVGLSRDALRFYEKKGIISAKKRENGYRYYSEEDIYRLMTVMYSRKMNFSLEAIEGMVNGEGSLALKKQQIIRQIEEIKREQEEQRRIMARLWLSQRDIERIEEYKGRFSRKRFPSAYILDTGTDFNEGLKRWFELASSVAGMDMAYFYNVLSWDSGELKSHGTQLLLYRELGQDMGEGFCPEDYPMTREQECVYTVLESRDMTPDYSVIKAMEDWAGAQGLCPEGIVYGNVMTSAFGKEGELCYLELYMPVSAS